MYSVGITRNYRLLNVLVKYPGQRLRNRFGELKRKQFDRYFRYSLYERRRTQYRVYITT